jgi:glycosidase
MMEFHISRAARDRYHFDQDLFALSGNVILANFQAVRQFAYLMNLHTDQAKTPGREVKAGEINAMGLIDEILHLVIGLYRREIDPAVVQKALRYMNSQYGSKQVDRTLLRFIDEFPSVPVYRGTQEKRIYLKGTSAGRSNREIVLEEMLLLWLANVNPAFSPYAELFDDKGMRTETPYLEFIDTLFPFFDKQPFFGPDHQNLLAMLRAPAIAAPNSLQGQLDFIRIRWASLLGSYLQRLLGSLDFLSEEEKAFIPGGPGPSQVYQFGQLEDEVEMFSRDSDWMPNCVLIAKNIYVWLDQLSRAYQQPIHRLDQIPDEELERLARLGMNGLWLIGLWERSRASQRIKQLCGNPDAVASAYSLADYAIASDLGGEAACHVLREKAARFGLKLASDMVPNHMGIDSNWLFGHPDWFLALNYSPFPSYSFNGPDLSDNPGVGLFLEDHYYSKNDAAVVFKRVERSNGREQFIYHGNDGTNMPWNDTAQLDYLNPQVREAVIQTILSVARRFPIIRFDAAMTLARKHYQRLWFPEPGSGGDIPTRSGFGMNQADFYRAMPQEFWREVVDRVAKEVPDTLLLAEAFWMMEGFFVRSLGMHRVYNSAFMHMLRDEENSKYRILIKNTLEFDPQILKRYVNFMNNPDEKTAVEQFGKGDKYFGICTLMATMPGLPMFGHGQIEGFGEKYGMEYRHAKREEGVDEGLVERHRREIAPLLHRRWLFSEVEHFLLYDFFTGGGQVNEDVFAYSNRTGDKYALVIYNNRFSHTDGWIKRSAAYTRKAGSSRHLVQTDLGEGLSLGRRANRFVIFREQNSGLEFIRSCQAVHNDGLHFELNAYQVKVLLDFREVASSRHQDYARLAAQLGERGVPNIDLALSEMDLLPILNPFRALSDPDRLRSLLGALAGVTTERKPAQAARTIRQDVQAFIQAAAQLLGVEVNTARLANTAVRRLEMLLNLPELTKKHDLPSARSLNAALKSLSSLPLEADADWLGLVTWIFLAPLGDILKTCGSSRDLASLLEDWRLSQELLNCFQQYGLKPEAAVMTRRLVLGLLSHPVQAHQSLSEVLKDVFEDPNLSACLQVNSYQGILWFNREAFRRVTAWLMVTSSLDAITAISSEPALVERILAIHAILKVINKAENQSECQVKRLIAGLGRSKLVFS